MTEEYMRVWLTASNVMAELEDIMASRGMGIASRDISLNNMGKATVTFTFNEGRLALTSDLRQAVTEVAAEEGAALVDFYNFWDARTLCIDLVGAPDQEVGS